MLNLYSSRELAYPEGRSQAPHPNDSLGSNPHIPSSTRVMSMLDPIGRGMSNLDHLIQYGAQGELQELRV